MATFVRKGLEMVFSLIFHNEASMDLSTLTSDVPSGATIPASRISAATRANLFQYILNLARDNAAFYNNLNAVNKREDPRSKDLLSTLTLLCTHVPEIDTLCQKLSINCAHFDASPDIQGNGYRSLLAVVDACLVKLLELILYMKEHRDVFYFRREKCQQEIREYVEVLGMLRAMLHYAVKMIDVEAEDATHNLFPQKGSELLEDWLVDVETLNQTCFFGGCTAFHLCPSVKAAMQTITTALAAFSERFKEMEENEPGTGPQALGYLAGNLMASRKFVSNPQLKAQELVTSTRDLDIRFCKAFWSISESSFWNPVHWYLLPSIDLNREFFIPPETFSLPRIDSDAEAVIKPPTVHIGERPLMCRMMSAQIREGQLFIESTDTVKSFKLPGPVLPKSDVLIYHLHGGGFVGQSSKACEIYLRDWVAETKVPMISVDYTLAPEGPYPRAVEESFYAYCWVLKYPHKMGWTGKKLVLVGDSAGGNLIFGITFKAFMEGIRMPDSLLAVYAPFLAQYTPSPSRLMSLMDPLIPMGILTRCLAAYAGLPEPTDVGAVQGFHNGSTTDSSPDSQASKASWDQLSPSELKGVEHMVSFDSTPEDELSIKEEEKHREQQRQEAIKAQQSFRFTVPGAHHVYHFASPVTTRVLSGVNHVIGIVNRGYNGIKNIVEYPLSKPPPPPARKRAKSIVNPSAPWTKMMNPLKRYNFAEVPVDDPLLSPLQADSRLIQCLPPVRLVAAHADPFLDDSVAFAKKLIQADKQVTLDLVPHLPHGFLNFVLNSEEARQGNRLVMEKLKELIAPDKQEVLPEEILA